MKKYAVKIQETLARTVIVEAESFDDAVDKAGNAYESGKIILEADDFAEVEFIASDTFGQEPITADAEYVECFTNLTAEEREIAFESLVSAYENTFAVDSTTAEIRKWSGMTHHVLNCFTNFVDSCDVTEEDVMSDLRNLLSKKQREIVQTVTVSTPVFDELEWETWKFISDHYCRFSGEEWKDDEPWNVIKTLAEIILLLLETLGTEVTILPL